jgi:hypothetical protein
VECSVQESGLLQVVRRDGWEWTLGGWKLCRGGAGWIRGKRLSTETFTECNSSAEEWSLVDVLQLSSLILR